MMKWQEEHSRERSRGAEAQGQQKFRNSAQGMGIHLFPAHLRMRPVSRGNSIRATWVGPQAERPRFPGPLLRQKALSVPTLGRQHKQTLPPWGRSTAKPLLPSNQMR